MLEERLTEYPKMPINVTGLFIHPIKILQADIDFLELVLEKINKMKLKNEKKCPYYRDAP